MKKWLVMETNLFFQARQTREKYRLSDEICGGHRAEWGGERSQ